MEREGRSGEETVGKPPQEPPSLEKLRCFRETLDVVFSLSDEYVSSLSLFYSLLYARPESPEHVQGCYLEISTYLSCDLNPYGKDYMDM